jgi:hypothetical protein
VLAPYAPYRSPVIAKTSLVPPPTYPGNCTIFAAPEKGQADYGAREKQTESVPQAGSP